jgi:hypothetical protein
VRVDVFGDGVDAVFAGACGVRDSVSLAGTFLVEGGMVLVVTLVAAGQRVVREID